MKPIPAEWTLVKDCHPPKQKRVLLTFRLKQGRRQRRVVLVGSWSGNRWDVTVPSSVFFEAPVILSGNLTVVAWAPTPEPYAGPVPKAAPAVKSDAKPTHYASPGLGPGPVCGASAALVTEDAPKVTCVACNRELDLLAEAPKPRAKRSRR